MNSRRSPSKGARNVWKKSSSSTTMTTAKSSLDSLTNHYPVVTTNVSVPNLNRKDPAPTHIQHRRHHRHSQSGSSTDTGSSRENDSRRYREEVRDESEMVISAVEKPKHHHHHHHRHKHRPREDSSSKSRYWGLLSLIKFQDVCECGVMVLLCVNDLRFLWLNLWLIYGNKRILI